MLLGNHEMLNAFGIFDYVDPGTDMDARGFYTADEVLVQRRSAAMGPGGAVARQLADNPVTLVIGAGVPAR